MISKKRRKEGRRGRTKTVSISIRMKEKNGGPHGCEESYGYRRAGFKGASTRLRHEGSRECDRDKIRGRLKRRKMGKTRTRGQTLTWKRM